MSNLSHKESEYFIAKQLARQKKLTTCPNPHARVVAGLGSGSGSEHEVLSNTSRVFTLDRTSGSMNL